MPQTRRSVSGLRRLRSLRPRLSLNSSSNSYGSTTTRRRHARRSIRSLSTSNFNHSATMMGDIAMAASNVIPPLAHQSQDLQGSPNNTMLNSSNNASVRHPSRTRSRSIASRYSSRVMSRRRSRSQRPVIRKRCRHKSTTRPKKSAKRVRVMKSRKSVSRSTQEPVTGTSDVQQPSSSQPGDSKNTTGSVSEPDPVIVPSENQCCSALLYPEIDETSVDLPLVSNRMSQEFSHIADHLSSWSDCTSTSQHNIEELSSGLLTANDLLETYPVTVPDSPDSDDEVDEATQDFIIGIRQQFNNMPRNQDDFSSSYSSHEDSIS